MMLVMLCHSYWISVISSRCILIENGKFSCIFYGALIYRCFIMVTMVIFDSYHLVI